LQRVDRGGGQGRDASRRQVGRERDAAAQRHRAMEQLRLRVDGSRRRQQRVDVDRACRLAHQRDVGRVAAELGDVVADELERLDDVEQREIARVLLGINPRLELRQVEEAEDAEPVVDRDDDGIGRLGQRRTVVDRIGGVAGDVAAAVHEHDHRPVAAPIGRPPDVEIEAVLAADRLVQCGADRRVVAVVGAGTVDASVLHAGIAELLRGARRFPRIGIDRRLPAQIARWRFRERDALPGIGAGAGVLEAHDGAEPGLPLHLGMRALRGGRDLPGQGRAGEEGADASVVAPLKSCVTVRGNPSTTEPDKP